MGESHAGHEGSSFYFTANKNQSHRFPATFTTSNTMEKEKLFLLQETIGKALLEFHDKIKEVCSSLSDDEMLELSDVYLANAKPNKSRNFSMPIYDLIAKRIQYELSLRIVFRNAEEYMNRTGEKYYCLACAGACQGHD